MENNKNMKELYKLYLELGHEVFEEKIKKPMELYYLHDNHDGGNVISMLSLNINIANDMESSKLGDDGFDEHDIFSPLAFEEKICYDENLPPIYDDYNDEYDLFSPPTIEDKVYYDYTMPPIYDDYHDDNDCFTLTIPNKKDFAYMKSNDTFMLLDHGNNVLCDSYIVEFIHDATEIYNERGRHGSKYLNNKKFPLSMLKVLKLHLFCLPMLVALCFNNYLCESFLKNIMANLEALRKSAFGRQPTFICFQFSFAF